MEFQEYQSLAYLVRIWRDSDEGGWRASVTRICDREERFFASLESLFQFILCQAEQSDASPCRIDPSLSDSANHCPWQAQSPEQP